METTMTHDEQLKKSDCGMLIRLMGRMGIASEVLSPDEMVAKTGCVPEAPAQAGSSVSYDWSRDAAMAVDTGGDIYLFDAAGRCMGRLREQFHDGIGRFKFEWSAKFTKESRRKSRNKESR